MWSTTALIQRKIRHVRAVFTLTVIAAVQLMSPSAAADPASKIDPPAWSYRHSQQEVEAYGIRVSRDVPEQQGARKLSQIRLRRFMREYGSKDMVG
jgi:hypothetical protein